MTMPAPGMDTTERSVIPHELATPRRVSRGAAIGCGAVPLGGGPASPDLLSGHGIADLLPMALALLLLAAAAIWMIRRWGARPPVLPPGAKPPAPPAPEPRAGAATVRPPAAALPAAS